MSSETFSADLTTGGQHDTITTIVKQREQTHGDFYEMSAVTQQLKEAMKSGRNWPRFNGMVREGLEMIVHKIARIVSGDPGNSDHWDDIQGYAKCVRDRLNTRGVFAAQVEQPGPQVGQPWPNVEELDTPRGLTVPSYVVLWEEKRRTVRRHRLREGVFELYLEELSIWVPQSECVRAP